MWIPNIRNKKKGLVSDEKKKAAEIVGRIAGVDKVTAAYASWMTIERRPKEGKKIYRYWWYAIGFNNQRFYIAPIFVSDKEGKIRCINSYCVDGSQLGLVNGKRNGK